MSNSLWEIGEDMRLLEAELVKLTEEEGYTDKEREELLSETFSEWLRMGGSFNDKAEQVASYIRQQEAISLARKEEIRRMQVLAKQAENQATRLREYLAHQMEISNIEKIEGITTKLSLRKKPARLVVNTEVEDLPVQFIKTTIKPDLTALKRQAKADHAFEYASLDTTVEYSLVIK